ncbi:MAG: transglutaminase domain-containing protein [Bacteroidaceae bacterium]|nr:transglutaminase domain-containing protein [Bacteroidaceae bacterium]
MKRLFLLSVLALALAARAQTDAIPAADVRADVDFLYQYMPLCDRADYPRCFFEANARQTRRALREMPWGARVNDTLVRHFVLSLRVNNEPLDSFRLTMYDELAARVRGLSMTEAAIEVNHWCHEKVTYQPTDGRTSSPLQSIRTAYGRCGEESTLCVAAMRAVGIPARQVYTPRWAHCDDNHAWVEVWTDGAWHFLGACEPEPVLDLGWFNAPASRGMLMHTCVFGDYRGPEDVVRRTPTYTEINVTPIYAPTRRVYIRVEDGGRPVGGARVEFKIYNYAEFFSAVTRFTDARGETSLVSGAGDLLVWASKDGRFGYKLVSFATDSLAVIELGAERKGTVAFDVHVPRARYTLPPVSAEARCQNDLALAREDSLRHAYELTMAALPATGATETDSLLWRSRGNHGVVRAFLDKYGVRGLPLLRTLTDKDLRDVTLDVLCDHQRAWQEGMSPAYEAHVLSPRVALEPLTPWRSVLQQRFRLESVEAVRRWCEENLRLVPDSNRNGTYVTPLGVLAARSCDQRSYNVFFVALCRAMGFEAWIDDVTGEVMTDSGIRNEELGVSASRNTIPNSSLPIPKSTLRFTGDPSLGYINRFTVARLTDEGTLSLLTFPEEAPLGTLEPKELPAGTYVLTTGTRQRSGDVLTEMTFFTLRPGEEAVVNVQPREDCDTSTVYGHIALPATACCSPTGAQVIVLLAEGQEPSNHVYRDICQRAAEFEQAALPVHFVFPSAAQRAKFRADQFPAPPANATLGDDGDGALQEAIARALPLHNASSLPLVVLVDASGDIRYYHQGYTIGIGDALLGTLNKKQ